MKEVLTFKVNLGTAKFLCPSLGEVEWSFAAAELSEQLFQLGLELRVGLGFVVFSGQLVEGCDKGFGDKAASEGSKVSAGVGLGCRGYRAHVEGDYVSSAGIVFIARISVGPCIFAPSEAVESWQVNSARVGRQQR